MSDATSVGRRVAGVFLLAVPFLADAMGAYVETTALTWILGIVVFAFSAGVVAWLAGRRGRGWADRLVSRWDDFSLAAVSATAATLVAILLLVVSWGVFRHRPLLVDSVAQRFQAEIFAHGLIQAPVPPIPAFWDTMHMIVDADGWYAQYPPGHAALLALGSLVSADWFVPVLLSLGTFFALVGFARRAYGLPEAKWTAILLAACPFFWFMGASFMNHVPALFGAAVVLYGVVRWEERGGVRWLAVAGAAAGLAFLARPFTILAFSVVPVAVVLAGAVRSRDVRAVLAGGSGFIPFVAAYLAFNARTTGDPLVTGYTRLWGAEHGLGFHATPWGEIHTPLTGWLHEASDLALLSEYLFEWPIPALLPVGLAFAAGWMDRDWDTRLLLVFLAVPAAYFFYWHHAVYLGPRFLYVTVAAIVPLTARSLVVIWSATRDRLFALGGDRCGSVGLAGIVLLALCVGYAALVGAPSRFGLYARSLVDWKFDLTERATEAGIEHGLVLVPVSWGNRIIAELHGLGVPAQLVEIAYRRVDHCRLEKLLGEAVAGGWNERRVSKELEGLIQTGDRTVATQELNGDPTLRLTPGEPLAPECVAEIRHDQSGYTNFAPHLVANVPSLDGPIVVARDLRERNDEILALYPERPAWIWRAPEFVPLVAAP